jgi:hypothetical protein
MTTKYDVGQEVYLMYENKVCKLKIQSIRITEDKIIEYRLNTSTFRNEKDIALTKEELIKQL